MINYRNCNNSSKNSSKNDLSNCTIQPILTEKYYCKSSNNPLKKPAKGMPVASLLLTIVNPSLTCLLILAVCCYAGPIYKFYIQVLVYTIESSIQLDRNYIRLWQHCLLNLVPHNQKLMFRCTRFQFFVISFPEL